MMDFPNNTQNDINYKSISCDGIPEIFLDKLIAKQHFGKFGKINRFILYPKRLSCIVEFETEEAARMALSQAGIYNGQVAFSVSYAKREATHVQNTEQWVDSEVQAELDAMKALNPAFHMQEQLFGTRFVKPTATAAPAATDMQCSPIRKKYSNNVSTQRVDANMRRELEDILKRPAYTDEEKFRVLDARDKLIRLTTVKQTDINKVKVTKGCCPDMCPEKERFMREFQRQVSPFEVANDGTSMSHTRAIKEYARSSADQEMPLAHELRSEQVLQMTMLYLMHNIMDLCDQEKISLADWFHFVWDRTRSIRKDITQQELCSLAAVELVEQCARFHIHCAARLVAEEPSVFDSKINAENLTKCLQTLKYMYHDLRVRNVRCPREAEFRSYIVLLNLGNANFMWELKKLPQDIQNSQEIERAICFYVALQNNNYVRFFNMVRSPQTSYLSACILLGYFNKLRARALEAIVRSVNKRNNTRFMSLQYLKDVLAFEDKESAACFCNSFGLRCEEERVFLDHLIYPDTEFCMERALLLVESKRNTSVGECIAGAALKPIDIYSKHVPHNSFDANGMLKLTAWNAEDQLQDADRLNQPVAILEMNKKFTTNAESNIFKVPQLLPTMGMKPQQPPQPQTNAIFAKFEMTKPMASNFTFGNQVNYEQNLFKMPSNASENVGGFTFKMPTSSQQVQQPLFKATSPTTTAAAAAMPNIFAQALASHKLMNMDSLSNKSLFAFKNDAAKSIVDEHIIDNDDIDEDKVIEEAEEEDEDYCEDEENDDEEEEDEAVEEEATIMQATDSDLDDANDKLQQQLEDASQLQLQSILNECITELLRVDIQQYQLLQKSSQQQCKQLLDAVVVDEVTSIMIEECKVQLFYNQLLLQTCFRRWRSYVRNNKNQNRLLKMQALWLTTETREEQTEQLQHPSAKHNLQLIKRYRHGEACDFEKLLWQDAAYAEQRAKINMLQVITQALLQQQHKLLDVAPTHRKYMKLLFTLPREMDELPGFESLCNKWLQKYVVAKPKEATVACKEAYFCAAAQQLALCVRKFSGLQSLNEYGQRITFEADNANGIICFMSCTNLKNSQLRLHNLLKQRQKCALLPIAFIVFDAADYDEQQLFAALALQKLINGKQLFSYKFFGAGQTKSSFDFIAFLTEALHFVSSESELLQQALQPLEMQHLSDWLASNLGEEMWLRYEESAKNNAAFQQLCRQPQNVIALHNEALQQLQQIVMENFENYNELPKELQSFVKQADVSKVQTLEYFPVNWKNAQRQQSIVRLLQKLEMPTIKLPDKQPTWQQLQLFLLDYASDTINAEHTTLKAVHTSIHCLKQQLQLVAAQLHMENALEALQFINWLHVLKHLVFAQMENICSTYKDANLPAEVIYRRQALVNYCHQPWWLNCSNIQKLKIDWTTFELHKQTALCERQVINDKENSQLELLQTMRKADLMCRKIDKRQQQQKTANADILKTLPLLQSKLNESIHRFELNRTLSDVQMQEQQQQLQQNANEGVAKSAAGDKRKRASDIDIDDIIAKAQRVLKKCDERELREKMIKTNQNDFL